MYSLALIIFVVSEKKAFEHFPIGSNVNLSCDGGHLGFPIGIKNRNLVMDIPTDDGRQVMAIVHLDLWSR